jgi:hypothetical protein
MLLTGFVAQLGLRDDDFFAFVPVLDRDVPHRKVDLPSNVTRRARARGRAALSSFVAEASQIEGRAKGFAWR